MFALLNEHLSRTGSLEEKISLLNSLPSVISFFEKYPFFKNFVFSQDDELLLKKLIAIGQLEALIQKGDVSQTMLLDLFACIRHVDRFYSEIGGIIGYQAKVLELLKGQEHPFKSATFHSPSFIDISSMTEEVKGFIEDGIDSLPLMAEIYPLGGAADRLHLVDPDTQVELPAAKLCFGGKTLLERLILDLEARELLYFKKYGKKLITPIAIMTSVEKNNHTHVVEICEKLNYFGRPKESIRFFTQPLVPAVDEVGNWHVQGVCKPLLKPGGHGAIWKLAKDEGIFNWFKELKRTKALVRQINNPIAGLDYGLLALIGIGCKQDMLFGFASCPRLLKAAEGVNVLVETKDEIVLTNIEYCDFEKFKIEDLPIVEGSCFSRFSSNTNILFLDLQAIEDAVTHFPFPGLLLNLKKGQILDNSGEKKEAFITRLESTMQNIADVFLEKKGKDLSTKRTFMTYNAREKTISTAKKAYVLNGPLQETPENCFYDLLTENRNCLIQCGFTLPENRDLESYLSFGPSSLFLYRPSFGPLYSDIQKKLKGGSLSLGSELLIEMQEFYAANLKLEGSLQIFAEEGAVCIMKNVCFNNRGVDWASSSPFWQMNLKRFESVQIILKKNSKLHIENLEILGSRLIVVDEGKFIKM